jgi:hypothetical protein
MYLWGKAARGHPLRLTPSQIANAIVFRRRCMHNETISHSSILEKLGGGGMGPVCKAKDTILGRFAAL